MRPSKHCSPSLFPWAPRKCFPILLLFLVYQLRLSSSQCVHAPYTHAHVHASYTHTCTCSIYIHMCMFYTHTCIHAPYTHMHTCSIHVLREKAVSPRGEAAGQGSGREQLPKGRCGRGRGGCQGDGCSHTVHMQERHQK